MTTAHSIPKKIATTLVSTSINPPPPDGTRIWNRPVTQAMTAWAVSLLNSPGAYPIFSIAVRQFGSDNVMARVEWHPWTYRNGVKTAGRFRGVTLYEVLTPLTPHVEGVNVSGYHRKVDWKQVATCKAFAFMAATCGVDLIERCFDYNWSGARNAGVLRGAVHCLDPSVDAVKQAEWFLSVVVACELPPVLALERDDNVSTEELVQSAKTWVEHVTDRLRRPLIYASPSFLQKVPTAGIEALADLWIAEWEVDAPSAVGTWPGWSFWQYTSHGTVPGITGSVELNRFNGSLDDLHTYLTRTADDGVFKPGAIDLTTTIGVQRALNSLKFPSQPLIEDGWNGPKTRAAVREFQRQRGLVVDGVVGEETRGALTLRLDIELAVEEARLHR